MDTSAHSDPEVELMLSVRDGDIRAFDELVCRYRPALTSFFYSICWNAVVVTQRLMNMGIEPFLDGDSTLGVISSVLARRICPECKAEYTPSAEALRWLGISDMVGKTTFSHGTGCENCKNTGYRGRIALHEVLAFDRELQRMVSAGQTDPNAVLRYAMEHGFITMIEVARKRVLEVATTAEEVFRLAQAITSGPV